MVVKLLEVRDSMTFIPVIATRLLPADDAEEYYLRRFGFIFPWGNATIVTRLSDLKSTYDPAMWEFLTGNTRTMQVAHEYIVKNFSDLESGDVVDVEFILKETPTPKQSERLEHPEP